MLCKLMITHHISYFQFLNVAQQTKVSISCTKTANYYLCF